MFIITIKLQMVQLDQNVELDFGMYSSCFLSLMQMLLHLFSALRFQETCFMVDIPKSIFIFLLFPTWGNNNFHFFLLVKRKKQSEKYMFTAPLQSCCPLCSSHWLLQNPR